MRREAALAAAKERRQSGEETEEQWNARYKEAQSKWVRTMIALPILFVTSYYLFERLAMGVEVKSLPENLRSGNSFLWNKPDVSLSEKMQSGDSGLLNTPDVKSEEASIWKKN
jgi:hypothetical protein